MASSSVVLLEPGCKGLGSFGVADLAVGPFANKFGEVTRKALEKQLAILFDGKVLTAPVVKEPLTGGNMSLRFRSTAEAEKVAAEELGAPATP